MASLFLVQTRKQLKDGRKYPFWELRESRYEPKIGAMKPRYIAYIGISKTITESKARSICEAKGLTLEQLRAVKGLMIVPDDQAAPAGRRRRAKPASVKSARGKT